MATGKSTSLNTKSTTNRWSLGYSFGDYFYYLSPFSATVVAVFSASRRDYSRRERRKFVAVSGTATICRQCGRCFIGYDETIVNQREETAAS